MMSIEIYIYNYKEECCCIDSFRDVQAFGQLQTKHSTA